MKLNDIFPEWLNVQTPADDGGVFFWLVGSRTDIPFQPVIDAFGVPALDIAFHGMHGMKTVSPVVRAIYAKYGEAGNAPEHLVNSIRALYFEPWKRLFDALEMEYNPIENYSMREKMTDDMTDARKSETASESNATTLNTARGYNEKIPRSHDGQSTGAKSGGKATEESAGKTVHTGERSGNIGVTTSQQMLESEINLRKFNYFRDRIFSDLAEYLTLSTYD